MNLVFFFLLSIFSFNAFSSVYLGGSYGYGVFESEPLDEYKVSPKGFNYGGFIGAGRDFVGLEGFYHSFTASGKIKHDGSNHDINTNASAFGAALRFSFQAFYLRLGIAKYTLNQSVDIDDESSRETAEELYEIQDGTSANGMLFGLGLHKKLGNSARGFIDYSRYQITSFGKYDTLSIGISFIIPERYIGFGKY